MTLNGAANYQIANCLAAIAACRAYGMESEAIAEALTEFNSNEHNAGRSNLYKVGAGYVLIDYGHNPDAFTAICRLASLWQGRRVTGVIGVPGDRDNLVVVQAGRAAAQGFHRLIIKEDHDLRGRQPSEVATLLHTAVMAERPAMDCAIVLDESEALRQAIQQMQADEIVVVFYEKLERIQKVLQEVGAAPIKRLPDLQPKSRKAAANLRVARG
jgi:cyanophycin synthetase